MKKLPLGRRSLMKRAKVNVRHQRQPSQYACVPTVLSISLEALGIPPSECSVEQVNKVLGAMPLRGASWEQVAGAASHYGCRATLVVPSTLRQVRAWTDSGTPVLIGWNTGNEWSHASLIFDVSDDKVWVLDPNIPNPDETVRVLSHDEFYEKWWEKSGEGYKVRRPAMAIEREITPDGRQVMAAQKKIAEAADCWHDWKAGGLTWEEYQACIRKFESGESDGYHSRPDYFAQAQWYYDWADIAKLMGRTNDANFIESVAGYVRRKSAPSLKQGEVLDRIKKRYTHELKDPKATLQRLRNPMPSPAPADKVVTPAISLDRLGKVKHLDALSHRVRGTDVAFVNNVKAIYESGGMPGEEMLKKTRNLFYKSGLKPLADHFRMAFKEAGDAVKPTVQQAAQTLIKLGLTPPFKIIPRSVSGRNPVVQFTVEDQDKADYIRMRLKSKRWGVRTEPSEEGIQLAIRTQDQKPDGRLTVLASNYFKNNLHFVEVWSKRLSGHYQMVKIPKAPPGKLVVDISTVPNQDFEPDSPQATVPKTTNYVVVKDLIEAQRSFKMWAQGIGSGNNRGGTVYNDKGKAVAQVSYNGRLWEVDSAGRPTRIEMKVASYSGNPDGDSIYPHEIDHGYEKPISGGSDVMSQLVNRLQHEQGLTDLVAPRRASLSSLWWNLPSIKGR